MDEYVSEWRKTQISPLSKSEKFSFVRRRKSTRDLIVIYFMAKCEKGKLLLRQIPALFVAYELGNGMQTSTIHKNSPKREKNYRSISPSSIENFIECYWGEWVN